MRPSFLFLLLALVLTACNRAPSSPAGIKEWAEVQAVAEAFVLKGDSEAFQLHVDLSGVSQKDLPRVKENLREWKSPPSALRHTTTEVMAPAEFETREEKEWLALSGGRPSTLQPTKWNIQPEKLVIFNFVSKDQPDKTKNIRLILGVFQKDGLWYFSTSDFL